MIPDWPEGTAAVLSTTGDDGRPHAIPVSTAVRRSATTVQLALGRGRATLANLRRDPRAALTIMAAGDVAVTLHGTAAELPGDVEGTVGLRLEVQEVQDHMQPSFTIEAGVAWRWTDDDAAARDEAIRARLRQE
jgi:nitroimidazol reductase NimA-like FMN-containing flavoprotein (pyridoxamine 5'-phosphate oxidase superfamily)